MGFWSDIEKGIKHIGGQAEDLVKGGVNVTKDILNPTDFLSKEIDKGTKSLHKKYKKFEGNVVDETEKIYHKADDWWDTFRGADKKDRLLAEAKRVASIPGAEETASEEDSRSLLSRRGRKSTQKVSRSLLGGRSKLG